MPLINKIEVSNFMNALRRNPWQPTWPHSVFDLLGLHSVINMPNGRGKTTLVKTILFLLAGDYKRMHQIRNAHFAPKTQGHYSHIRVQMTMDTEEAAGLDLFTGSPLGQQMVFGVYGQGGENEQFYQYAYPGVLEDCPVHQNNCGNKIVLIDNNDFDDRLSSIPGRFPTSAKDATRDAWKGFITRRFDTANLSQQITYQINAGAEGKSSYFEVPRSSQEYSAAVFYEHLAPQLLTDVMGSYGAEDERSIEDTIHEKARQVAQARFRSEIRRRELVDTERVLHELQRIGDAAEEMGVAGAQKADCQSKLYIELAVLKNIVVDNPIYGLPPRPPEGLPEITKYLVMVEGAPYLPDRAFEAITGEEAKVINQKAQRHNINSAPVDNSQVIEISCDQKTIRDERGRESKIYDLSSVELLLHRTESFLPGLYKDSIISDVQRAFEWAKEHGDTNPARMELTTLREKLSAKRLEQKSNIDERESLGKEKIKLFQEQQQVGEQQAEFRRMLDSGLFSAEEMAAPTATGEKAVSQCSKAENAFNVHNQQVARREEVFTLWQRFTRQHPGDSPQVVMDVLIAEEAAAQKRLDDLKFQRQGLHLKRIGLKEATTAARSTAGTLKSRMKEADDTLFQAQQFETLFQGEDPNGLESRVKADLKSAQDEKTRFSNELARIAEEVKSIAEYQNRFGSTEPGSWLRAQSTLYAHAQKRKDHAAHDLEEARISLKNLHEFSVAPGQYARAVASEVKVPFAPLHAEVERLNLLPARKETILTLFSALLFAPVLQDEDAAATAAKNLAAKGIEFPVFVRSDLEQFCLTGKVSGESDIARGLFIGVRTRSVDCLLDVNLVEREKKHYEEEIAALSKRLRHLAKAVGRLSHETPNARLAERARQALERGVIEEDKELREALASLHQKLPRLEARFEAINSIKAVLRHRLALAGLTIAELRESLAEAEGCLRKAETDEGTVDAEIDDMTLQVDSASGQLQTASIARRSNEQAFRQISEFIDDAEHGPEFMASAEVVRGVLQGQQETARKRSSFRFSLAQQFVTSGSQRPQEIESRIGEITARVKTLVEDQETLDKEVVAIEELHAHILGRVSRIDDIMSSLTKLYKRYRHLPTGATADLSRHDVYRACSFLRSADKINECIERILKLKPDLDTMKETLSELSGNFKQAEASYDVAAKHFNAEIDRVTGDSTLKIGEHQIYLLGQASSEPTRIRGMLATALSNFEKEKLANETARQELDQEWREMDSWLTEFTKRLPTNLAALKSTFAPKYDKATNKVIKAGFEIGGEVIRFEDIEAVMEDIVRDIEDYEKDNTTLRRDTHARKVLRDSFRKGIRDKFYQRVLQNVYIKVCIPAISETPLKLGPNIVSSGQGVAMTLLWIVKLADFVAERERRRKTITNGQVSISMANKLRKVESQFVFIDGAFSHLSDRALIDDVLSGIMQTRGRFQLIVTGHEPEYKHNFEYFPSFVCAREIGGRYMYVENGKPVHPSTAGSNYGAMTLMRATQISHPSPAGETNGSEAN